MTGSPTRSRNIRYSYGMCDGYRTSSISAPNSKSGSRERVSRGSTSSDDRDLPGHLALRVLASDLRGVFVRRPNHHTFLDHVDDVFRVIEFRKKSLSAFVVAKIFARAAWRRCGIGQVPRRMPSENAMSSGPHSANARPGHLGVLEQAVKNFTTACQICAITPRRQHPFSFAASVSFIVRNSRARRVATHAAAGSQSDCRMSVQRSY
jgi:hypothetical protein